MKYRFILFLILLSLVSISFQTDPTLKVDKHGYIAFSDNNFIKLLHMDKKQWELEVKSLGYELWADEDGVLMYMKGEFTKSWHTAIFDYKLGMVGILWWDVKNKEKLMENYRASMPSNFLSQNLHVTTYSKSIEGRRYTILMSNSNDVVSEEVRFGYKK